MTDRSSANRREFSNDELAAIAHFPKRKIQRIEPGEFLDANRYDVLRWVNPDIRRMLGRKGNPRAKR